LAVSSALRFSLSGLRRSRLKLPAHPLFEFNLRPGHCPVNPSQPAAATPAPLMGFASLQHLRNRRSTSRGLCLPATFRPQGLATLSTACSLRDPAGFVSRRRRSWDSPFGAFPSRAVPARFRTGGPTYRFTQRFSRRLGAGPARWAPVSGLRPPRESLATERVFSTSPAGCSPGFCPF
jgi:hypothetical protein